MKRASRVWRWALRGGGVVACAANIAASAPARAEPPPVKDAAEQSPAPVDVYPWFEVGDSRTITIERSRQRSGEDGVLMPAQVGRSTATVRVVEEPEESWVLEWSLGAAALEGLGLPAQRQEDVERLLRELAMPDLRLELFPDGSVRLLNLDEVRGATLRGIAHVVETQLTAMGPEKREQVRATASGMYDDPAAAEVLLLGQVSPYFAAYGYELTPGESVSGAIEMPNALTAPVAAELTVTLLKDVPRAGLVTVREVRTLTPEGSKSLTEAMRERFAAVAPPDKPFPENMSIELRMESEWVYDEESGWFNSVTVAKDVASVIGEERSVMIEKTTYTLEDRQRKGEGEKQE